MSANECRSALLALKGADAIELAGARTPLKFLTAGHIGTTQICSITLQRDSYFRDACPSVIAVMSLAGTSLSREFKWMCICIMGENKARHNIFYNNPDRH